MCVRTCVRVCARACVCVCVLFFFVVFGGWGHLFFGDFVVGIVGALGVCFLFCFSGYIVCFGC